MTARSAWAQVAHEFRALADAIDAAIEQPEAGGASPAHASPPRAPQGSSAPAAPLPPKRQAPDASAFTKCPAHGTEWQDGRFGPYCTGKGEPDGNWYNDKGYCRITPKSAGAWLKQHPQGAPAPGPQDVDDIPF